VLAPRRWKEAARVSESLAKAEEYPLELTFAGNCAAAIRALKDKQYGNQ